MIEKGPQELPHVNWDCGSKICSSSREIGFNCNPVIVDNDVPDNMAEGCILGDKVVQESQIASLCIPNSWGAEKRICTQSPGALQCIIHLIGGKPASELLEVCKALLDPLLTCKSRLCSNLDSPHNRWRRMFNVESNLSMRSSLHMTVGQNQNEVLSEPKGQFTNTTINGFFLPILTGTAQNIIHKVRDIWWQW